MRVGQINWTQDWFGFVLGPNKTQKGAFISFFYFDPTQLIIPTFMFSIYCFLLLLLLLLLLSLSLSRFWTKEGFAF